MTIEYLAVLVSAWGIGLTVLNYVYDRQLTATYERLYAMQARHHRELDEAHAEAAKMLAEARAYYEAASRERIRFWNHEVVPLARRSGVPVELLPEPEAEVETHTASTVASAAIVPNVKKIRGSN